MTKVPTTKLPWRIAAVSSNRIEGDETVSAEKYLILGANATVATFYRQGDAAFMRALLDRHALVLEIGEDPVIDRLTREREDQRDRANANAIEACGIEARLENAENRLAEALRIIARAQKRLGSSGRPHPNDVSWTRTILAEADALATKGGPL